MAESEAVARAETEVAEALRRKSRLLDLSPVANIARELDGTITFWSAGAERLYGWSKEEALGRRTHDLLRTEFPKGERLETIVDKVGRGEPWSGVLRHYTRDGRWVTVQSYWLAELDANGQVLELLESNTDITEHEKASEAARESGARLDGIITSAMDAIISINQQQRVLLFNPAAERMFGLGAGEALGQPLTRFIPERFRAAHGEHVKEFGRTGVSNRHMGALGMVWGLRANGEEFPIEASISQIESRGEKLFTVVLRDVSQRLEVERALRESEARFRLLAENIPHMAWMADGEGWIFWYNQRWFDYTGTTLEQMQGWGWQAVHHPEHVERVKERFKRALESGEPWEDTFPLRGKNGEYRWFLSRAFPIRESGRTAGWFGTNTDITELRETHEALAVAQGELRQHAERLEQTVSERTAELRRTVNELEAFSYTLSHDMRAPLRAILSFSEIALEESRGKVDAGTTEMLSKVTEAAQRMERLIQDVLALSRVSRQDIELAAVDLDKLVWEVIRERPALEEPRARVEVGSPLLPVVGHEASLRQCLTNLLSNAVKFVAAGVKPHVRIHTEARGDRVRLWVEDNGIGIPREAQAKIFKIFQRLHRTDEYEGTGIGLAIVQKAVERMGGKMGVESELRKGSRFWVELRGAE